MDCLHLHAVKTLSGKSLVGLKRALCWPLGCQHLQQARIAILDSCHPRASSAQCKAGAACTCMGKPYLLRGCSMLPGVFKGHQILCTHPQAGPLSVSSRPFSSQQHLLLNKITDKPPLHPKTASASRSACPTQPAAPPRHLRKPSQGFPLPHPGHLCLQVLQLLLAGGLEGRKILRAHSKAPTPARPWASLLIPAAAAAHAALAVLGLALQLIDLALQARPIAVQPLQGLLHLPAGTLNILAPLIQVVKAVPVTSTERLPVTMPRL